MLLFEASVDDYLIGERDGDLEHAERATRRPDPHDPKDAALLRRMGDDPEVRAAWKRAFDLIAPYRYAYNWSWLGRPGDPVSARPGGAAGDHLAHAARGRSSRPGSRTAARWSSRPRCWRCSAASARRSGSTSTSARTTAPRSRRTRWPRASRCSKAPRSTKRSPRACASASRAAPRWSMLDSNHTADHVARELDAVRAARARGLLPGRDGHGRRVRRSGLDRRPAVGPGQQPDDRGRRVPRARAALRRSTKSTTRSCCSRSRRAAICARRGIPRPA